jgi:nucleoside-diphosphate-sugar epimerase
MKKVLICGATGFIGRNIAEKFCAREDIDVYGTYLRSEPLTDLNIKMIKADLTRKDDVDRAVKGMDIVIQAAATTSGAKEILSKPYYHVTDNAVMNSLIFRAAFEHRVSHVVFLSCTVMYQPGDKPVKESDFNANQEIFPAYFGVGWTKVYIEKMCEFYSKIGEAKYTVIRHSNIYGPHDKYDLERSHVFGATLSKVMMTEEGGKVIVWGSGKAERDLLYVSDLVDFVEIAIEKQEAKHELCNIGLGRTISVNDLVKKIVSHSEKKLTIENDLSKPDIKTRLCLDISKAQLTFNWQPKVTLDEGIKKTMEWYRSNIKGEKS